MPMDVSTDFLRTFIAVCHCKSFTLAATRVHKSQAAISAQIAKLENQAGSKFIDRSQRQFRLTKEGELFLSFAQEMIAKTDTAQQTLQALHNSVQEEVRVGATRSIGIHILPDVFSSIAKDFPNLKMSLLTQARAATYECLQQGTLDFAFVLADAAPRGFFTKPLRSVPLCFVISPKHPLAAKKVVSTEELKTVPFISGMKGNDLSDLIDEVFEKHHISRPAAHITMSNLRARMAAARAGVGVTVLPHFTVREELENKTLKVLTIKEGELPDTQLMLVQAHRRLSNANVERVKKALEEKLAAGSRHESLYFSNSGRQSAATNLAPHGGA
jgi:DNA-binding transcriptional LysR family regulator